MKNYILTFFGILLSIIGVTSFFMISKSRYIGMILMIFGLLLCIKSHNYFKKNAQKKKNLQKKIKKFLNKN